MKSKLWLKEIRLLDITDEKGGKSMSEIKGQLLGIILVLVVFGAISVTMATVFKKTGQQVAQKAENPGAAAETAINSSGSLLTYGD